MNEEVGERARRRRKGKEEEEWMKRRKVEVQAHLLVVHDERGKMDNRGETSEEGSQI